MAEKRSIDIGIKMERDSIKFYSEQAGRVTNRLAKQILESFVADEKKHLELLESIKSEVFSAEVEESDEAVIVIRSKNAFEDVPEDVLKTLESDPGDIEVIGIAIRLEEEGQKYYLETANCLANIQEKDLFAWLAGEEEEHAFVLRNTLEYLNSPADWLMGEEQWNFEGG
jgi:rubrerythrin